MLSLLLVNRILAGLYLAFALYSYIAVDFSAGADAAGKGMVKGFAVVFGIFGVAMLLLSFIKVKWVAICICVVLLLPIAFWLSRVIREILL